MKQVFNWYSCLILIVIGLVTGCGSSPTPATSSGPSGDDCSRLLEGGVWAKYQVQNRKELSAKIRDSISGDEDSFKHSLSENHGGGKASYVKLFSAEGSGGGTDDLVESLKKKFAHDSSYELSDSEMQAISATQADENLLDHWSDCIARIGEHANKFELRLDRSIKSDETIVLNVVLPQSKEAKFDSLILVGVDLVAPQIFKPGEPLKDGAVIVLTPIAGKDIVVVLNSNVGTAKFARKAATISPKVVPDDVHPKVQAKSWHRENPAGNKYTKIFSYVSEDRGNKPSKLSTKQFTLDEADARIYDVTLVRSGRGAPWNYHRQPAPFPHQYDPDFKILDGGQVVEIYRDWAGWPTTETYTIYYEVFR